MAGGEEKQETRILHRLNRHRYGSSLQMLPVHQQSCPQALALCLSSRIFKAACETLRLGYRGGVKIESKKENVPFLRE